MTDRPPRVARIVVALAAATACAWASHSARLGLATHLNGGDFGYAWRAARWLLAGESPYARMDPAAAYGTGGPFLYPLTAALAALPFAPFPVDLAGPAFVGVSAGLFAYGLTKLGWLRLVAMVSPPFLLSLQTGNWPPLLAAAALLPGLGWLAAAKPNLGLVSLAYAPRRAALAGAAALVGLSLLVMPGWPLEWLAHLRRQPTLHVPAVLWPAGFLGLVGLLRWRTPEGRALAALTVVPTATWPYDWVLLWLCARSGAETAALTVVAWITWFGLLALAPMDLSRPWSTGHLVLALGWILPAAVLVLRRPNSNGSETILELSDGARPAATLTASHSSYSIGSSPTGES